MNTPVGSRRTAIGVKGILSAGSFLVLKRADGSVPVNVSKSDVTNANCRL